MLHILLGTPPPCTTPTLRDQMLEERRLVRHASGQKWNFFAWSYDRQQVDKKLEEIYADMHARADLIQERDRILGRLGRGEITVDQGHLELAAFHAAYPEFGPWQE